MWKNLRILLLGEPKVGKTSLILSLVSEEFAEEVPAKAEEITIPADVTPEKVPTHIVDFSSAEQGTTQLYDELAHANVVCLVYDLSNPETLRDACELWLPLIRENSRHNMPIILVGNKSDLVNESKMDDILPVMNEYPEIETCIECSAKTLKNISEMFYFAQKAVLHPTGPLYCSRTGMLKDDCKTALTRIFHLCDLDKDGFLSDAELSNFQKICFNTPLAAQALQDVKDVVHKNCTGGVTNGKLTVEGFIFLHSLFIQRGRHETTWAALRKFGYSDDLVLTEQYLFPAMTPPYQDSICQLTNETYQFLENVFHVNDKDKDGCLNENELGAVFSVFPDNPWGNDDLSMVHSNRNGWISLNGFLSKWTVTAYSDFPKTMEYLAYLGYSTLTGRESQADAVECIPVKSVDDRRKVYVCKVIGHHGAGKTTLLQSLLGRSNVAYDSPLFAINTMQVKGCQKYLLLHEVDSTQFMESDSEPLVCDIACLAYDVSDPESFQECVAFHKLFLAGTDIPCLVLGLKSDLTVVKQHCAVQPMEFCRLHKIPSPLKFSIHGNDGKTDIFESIAVHAACSGSLNAPKKYSLRSWVKICLATAALSALGFVIYRNFSLSQKIKPVAVTK